MTDLDDLRNTGSNLPQVGATAAACRITTCYEFIQNCFLCVSIFKGFIVVSNQIMCMNAGETDR